MLTLRDALNEMKPKTKIKIGAADGSSWFVISDAETVQSHISEIDDALTSYLKTRSQRAEDSLATSIKNPMDLKAYMAKQLVRHKTAIVPDFSWEGYMAEFEKYRKSLEAKRQTCIDYEEALATAKPLMDREVLGMDKSIAGDGIRILVEGTEEGLWWDSSEKKKGEIYGFRTVKETDDI